MGLSQFKDVKMCIIASLNGRKYTQYAVGVTSPKILNFGLVNPDLMVTSPKILNFGLVKNNYPI